MAALPRAHRSSRSGPAGLRALGQARLAALHDRPVRRVPRAIPRAAPGAASAPRLQLPTTRAQSSGGRPGGAVDARAGGLGRAGPLPAGALRTRLRGRAAERGAARAPRRRSLAMAGSPRADRPRGELPRRHIGVSGEATPRALTVRDGVAGAPGSTLGALARAPAWTITAVLGCVYLIASPASADLAAASYRSDLFGRTGFSVWDNGWYGGHHLPAYSVLAPALGWLIGPRVLATLSLITAAALFEALIAGRFAPHATRIAAAWFALGAAIALLSCRVPFDLGLAAGL